MNKNPSFSASKKEEWVKYFVNDIECKRDAIYQTILANKFYTGKITLSKKYHFLSHEDYSEEEEDECGTVHRNRKISYQSKNPSATFTLNTKQFADKVTPNSKEYMLLIDKMIYIVEVFYEAEHNHAKYSQKLRAAIRDCMSFLLDPLMNNLTPYEDIRYKISIETLVFSFDILAFKLSEEKKPVEFPVLTFDLSCIKEIWNEHWTHSKKSQFLNEYLSVLLKQTEDFAQLWLNNDLFDEPSKNKMTDILDDLKEMINAQQIKRSTLDKTLANPSDKLILSNTIYNFHHKPQSNNEAHEPESQTVSNALR